MNCIFNWILLKYRPDKDKECLQFMNPALFRKKTLGLSCPNERSKILLQVSGRLHEYYESVSKTSEFTENLHQEKYAHIYLLSYESPCPFKVPLKCPCCMHQCCLHKRVTHQPSLIWVDWPSEIFWPGPDHCTSEQA